MGQTVRGCPAHVDLKSALIISCALHGFLFIGYVQSATVTVPERTYDLEVSYYKEERIPVMKPAKAVRPQPAPSAPAVAKVRETSLAASEKPVRPEAIVSVKPKSDSTAPSQVSQKPVSAVERLQKREKNGLSYYQVIREKIRRALGAYTSKGYRGSGDIYLEFTLGRDGSLLRTAIDEGRSSRYQELSSIVKRAMADASPFPRLPPDVRDETVTFSITITFRER